MALTSTLKQLREASAGDIGVYFSAIVEVVAGAVLSVAKLTRVRPSPDHLRDAYVTEDGATWRRVTTVAADLTTVTLDSTLPALDNGDTVGFYFFLTPEEMNNAISEEHRTNSYEHRESITLVVNVNEYALPTWVQTRAQVMDVYFRLANSGAVTQEENAVSWRILQTGNALTLHIIHMPILQTGLTCVVRLRRYYDALTADATTTTMPYELALRMAEVALYKRLRRSFGDDYVRRLFGEEMREAFNDYARIQFELEPPLVATDLAQDFAWNGPDIPIEHLVPGW